MRRRIFRTETALVVVYSCCALAGANLQFTTLLTMPGGINGTLAQGTDGNFYGTISSGGSGVGPCSPDCGTVFRMTPQGVLTTIYNFCSQPNCADGWQAQSPLVLGNDGNFYGTTHWGGTGYFGTIFKITPAGVLTTLYSFACSPTICPDGSSPAGTPLVQAAGGSFYGGTPTGGANTIGTIFKITPEGALTTLYNFCSAANCADGAGWGPSVMVQAQNGNFYGTTIAGGALNCPNGSGCGTVFGMNPSGALKTIYDFCAQPSCADGSQPVAGLVQTADGDFYGTTSYGGANGGGTVFRITPGGALTTLYSFTASTPSVPNSTLVEGANGNFYGTSSSYPQRSTIYEIAPNGKLTVLHQFPPYAEAQGLVQGTDGLLYGASFSRITGGAVFSLSTGLPPLVNPVPQAGHIGTAVIILGTNLTGATAVTFNGTPAAFTVVSPTEITTTVPAGASTGRIQVTTPNGTLWNVGRFVVTK